MEQAYTNLLSRIWTGCTESKCSNCPLEDDCWILYRTDIPNDIISFEQFKTDMTNRLNEEGE